MDKRINTLQKRTKGDMICSFVAALVAVGIAVTEFWAYISTDGIYPEHLTNGIYAIFAFGITMILGLILLEVHKIGKPFSKRIINELRVLAVFVILGGVLPDSIAPIIEDVVNGTSSQISVELVMSAKNVIVSIIGVVIGVVSEIFVYGYELQDDVDSIA